MILPPETVFWGVFFRVFSKLVWSIFPDSSTKMNWGLFYRFHRNFSAFFKQPNLRSIFRILSIVLSFARKKGGNRVPRFPRFSDYGSHSSWYQTNSIELLCLCLKRVLPFPSPGAHTNAIQMWILLLFSGQFQLWKWERQTYPQVDITDRDKKHIYQFLLHTSPQVVSSSISTNFSQEAIKVCYCNALMLALCC